ncbi:hypothetical protein GCM10007874_13720 [Labrys miyagiensis]|uniref:Uncharacterized protein n=1 Tax=Labrys miyagiensis TaxID=346912 RepID=A0ABQ6CHN3_9HYPH|nr:hypothetical protein [Labrys miyagiensis]GLS18355.1 hypothetical protein GCM10007874_13720 [Labrys miyagiensis]
MPEPSLAIRLYGTEESSAQTRLLKAGPLSAELDGAALRAIRLGGIEMIRAIAFLIRDENWGTLSPEITDLAVEESSEGFSVSYRATCEDAKRKLVYDAHIAGRSDGSLDFEVTAHPHTDVLTNRTGFIVLHPLVGVAGQPVKVQHVEGPDETAAFPDRIDPMQPFLDIRSLSHEVVPGTWVTCTMTGDTFEMEDQRNWTDASYKTYVRPLARPWPYTLKQGEPIAQAVKLSISGDRPKAAASVGVQPINVTLDGETTGRLPAIGIGVPAEEAPHALQHIDRLKALGARFLVCEVDRRHGDGLSELQAYRKLAEALRAEVTLEIIIPGSMDPAADLSPVAEAVAESGLKPTAIEVFPAQDMKSVLPGSPWPEMPGFEAILGAARAAFPGVKLGGGMATYFTELNRKRPPAALLDFVTHTTCPTVHAADDRSVMETLESLPYVFLSTKAFMGEKPYRVGPSSIGCRENPYGRATTPNPDNRRACLSRLDPRQRGLFNAAYTLGYAAACARGGVSALSMGAPTGPFGFIHRHMDGPHPFYESQPDGALYPAFHVMAALAADGGARLVEAKSDRKTAVEAFAYRAGKGTVLWLANLTSAVQEVVLKGVDGARIATLDETNFVEASTRAGAFGQARTLGNAPLSLLSYAVARIEIG